MNSILGNKKLSQPSVRPEGEEDFALAMRHERGQGAKKDFFLALKHYRAAAKAGHLPAQLRLAHIYLNGENLSQPRYQDARDYFYLAAKQGNAEAQTEIGWLYYQGQGVAENPAEAIRYLQLAADQGNIKAAGQLGWIYFHGWKTKNRRTTSGILKPAKDPFQNPRKAVNWLRRASELGDINSMHGLAICLLEGKVVKPQPKEECACCARRPATESKCPLITSWTGVERRAAWGKSQWAGGVEMAGTGRHHQQ